jgi:hypothetical protein
VRNGPRTQRGPVAPYPAGPRASRVPAVLPDRHTAPSMAPLASLTPPPTAPMLERVAGEPDGWAAADIEHARAS